MKAPLFIALLLALPWVAYAGDDAGKEVFEEYKCQTCHSVNRASLSCNGKSCTDLSGVGKKHDAATIEAYLLKQKELDGKKHKKKFRGEDKDLKALIKWLASLKEDAK